MTDTQRHRWLILCPLCGKESLTDEEYTVEEIDMLRITRLEGDKLDTECNDCRLCCAEITGGGDYGEFI